MGGELQRTVRCGRTESINTSRMQKQTRLALRLTELLSGSSTAMFWLKNQKRKEWKRAFRNGGEVHLTQCTVTLLDFSRSFPNTPLLHSKNFFYRCLENGGMWFFQPFLYRFQAHHSIYRNALEVRGGLFQPCWHTRSFFWSTKERL